MAKSGTENDNAVELRSDGWKRFTQAVHAAATSGPKHKVTPKAKAGEAEGGRERAKNAKTKGKAG